MEENFLYPELTPEQEAKKLEIDKLVIERIAEEKKLDPVYYLERKIEELIKDYFQEGE